MGMRFEILSLRICCVLFAVVAAYGQTASGNILGVVTDPGDAVVPGVSLVLTDQSTGATRRVESTDAGLFRFVNLPPSTYTLRVEAQKGFASLEVKGIVLSSNETRDLGRLQLKIGTIAESVEVTAQATPVQIASSERSALLDSTQLTRVTVKGRDPMAYARLLPGIVDTGNTASYLNYNTSTARDTASSTSLAGIAVNGSANSNINVDGINTMDGSSGVLMPNLDAISEIKIVANGLQAQFGRSSGANIAFITKSGGREYHGTAFWSRRHENLNANTFFNNRQNIPRPIYRYLTAGFSIGGPITIPNRFNTNRDRLFFFFSQEYMNSRQPTLTSMGNQPTEAMLKGDFSGARTSTGDPIVLRDPTIGSPFPESKIPQARINPIGLALLKLVPLSNGYVNPAPGQAFNYNFRDSGSPFQWRRDTIARVDFLISPSNTAYVRFGYDNTAWESPFNMGVGIRDMTRNDQPGYSFGSRLTSVISPKIVNEITFGSNYEHFQFYLPEKTQPRLRSSTLDPPRLGPVPTGPQYMNFLPIMRFDGGQLNNQPYYSFGAAYTYWPIDFGFPLPYKGYASSELFTWVLQDDLSIVVGSHSLKSGLYIERMRKHDARGGGNIPSKYMGYYAFGSDNFQNPLDTGIGFANALLGNFQYYRESTARIIPDSIEWQVEGYLQDSWRIGRRLTIDYGVRWYHIGTIHDNSNAVSLFNPTLWDPSKAAALYRPAIVNGVAVAQDPRNPANTTYLAAQYTIVPGSGEVANGMRVNGMNGDGVLLEYPFLRFSPRFGFAWDVTGDGKTSIRGAIAYLYNRPNLPTAPQAAGDNIAPVSYLDTIYYSSFSGLQQTAGRAARSPVDGFTIEKNYRPETGHQWNFTIQRAIGFGTVVDVGYVGNFARHANQNIQINPIPLRAYADPNNLFMGAPLNPNLLRKNYPGMGNLQMMTSSLSSLNYHGLQFAANRRMSRRLGFQFSYTFSKALGTSGWDPWHTHKWFYTPLGVDRSHVVGLNWNYDLPGPTRSPLKHTLGNWILSGTFLFTTGAPVTPTCISLSPGIENQDPSLSGGGARCQAVADPKSGFTKSFYSNFNTAAFSMAPAGTFGNINQGILRQPSYHNLDLTLGKRFTLKKEGRSLAVRVEAYNVLNHAEFNAIDATYRFLGNKNTNTTTGQYTGTQPARVIQTTLRLEF